jgi:hypothetical protein
MIYTVKYANQMERSKKLSKFPKNTTELISKTHIIMQQGSMRLLTDTIWQFNTMKNRTLILRKSPECCSRPIESNS